MSQGRCEESLSLCKFGSAPRPPQFVTNPGFDQILTQLSDLARLRGALAGTTYKRSRKEARGRRPKLSDRAIPTLNEMLKQLIKNAGKQHEVRWEDIRKAACAPRVHRATLKRSFGRLGQKVQACSPHAKPNRTPGQAIHRVAYCRQWPREPPSLLLECGGPHYWQPAIRHPHHGPSSPAPGITTCPIPPSHTG